ncbi:DsbA family protein [Bosea sp. AS-1]|jgi:protein-disulfide isomerase|uniref:DsbA family protein n=1 Tax=Bosea sp. AS-1 TaxID=2015316 RepID=UPI000B78E295|nr:DsbA family protein [Bosea sp. AS-1]
MTNRRQLLTGAAGIAAAALAGAEFAGIGAARAQTKLPDAGPLGDVWLGPADAKVTVIEYASMTCSHCAHFHETTWPELKKKYIDTGKIRFSLREFPLDPLAMAGFMLARCNGNDKYYPMTDLLFSQQKNWAFVDKPVDALSALVKQGGFTQESFEACLKRQDIYDAITQVKDGGAKAGVDATPTFFVNGQKVSGAVSIAEFDKVLEPLLAK